MVYRYRKTGSWVATKPSWEILLLLQVEEQPRKLEHVIKVSHLCLYRDQPQLDNKSDTYLEQVRYKYRTATGAVPSASAAHCQHLASEYRYLHVNQILYVP